MEASLLHSFQKSITQHAGLYFRPEDCEVLDKSIHLRMDSLRLRKAEEYLTLLDDDRAANDEWQQLIKLITTGESYFFRDKEQMALLRDRIFPELLQEKGERASLRLWSAGCSTGEEPYSLAMLLNESLPPGGTWKILIIGTDINAAAIEKAKAGMYTEWSFRMVEPELRKRYFRKVHGVWVLDETIRSMVTFQVANLKSCGCGSFSELHDMDLIVCRNTFIYFDRDTVASVLRIFIETLAEGGYFLSGHGDLHDQKLGALRPLIHPESVIYRKETQSGPTCTDTLIPAGGTGARLKPEALRRVQRADLVQPKAKVWPGAVKQYALRHLPGGEQCGTVDKAKAMIAADPGDTRGYNLLARAYADLGDYESAAASCRKALELDVTSALPYFVLAQIAQLHGDRERAKEMLKKVIYLEPASVAAYLELANLYEQEGDGSRARKMRATAMEFLRTLPSGSPVEPYRETAGEILRVVSGLMGP